MHVLPAGWWAGGPSHGMKHLNEDVDLVLVWNAAARSDMGRHAAAVREAVRQHGPPELSALEATQEGTSRQAEVWLGRLIMDTVRMAVGLASALRYEHDVPGGPSQGAVTYATLPESMHDDDYLELGSRAVESWLGSLTGQGGAEEPGLSQVFGGEHWGLPDWTLHWAPKQVRNPEGLPKHFGRARATQEARHWNDTDLRVNATGWMGARAALRPQVESAMRAWGTPSHVAEHPLKWDWRDMAYTDGSMLKPRGYDTGPG